MWIKWENEAAFFYTGGRKGERKKRGGKEKKREGKGRRTLRQADFERTRKRCDARADMWLSFSLLVLLGTLSGGRVTTIRFLGFAADEEV